MQGQKANTYTGEAESIKAANAMKHSSNIPNNKGPNISSLIQRTGNIEPASCKNAEPVFFIKVSLWNKKVPSSEQLHNFHFLLNNIRGTKINYEMERTCNRHGKRAVIQNFTE